MTDRRLNRREWLYRTGALICAKPSACAMAPTAPVAIAACRSYGPAVLPTLARMFDQLGGLGGLVRNKTVAIKLNLGGPANLRLGYMPNELTNWVHPDVIWATLHLLAEAGARRLRLLEGARFTGDPLEEHMLEAGWEPRDFLSAAPLVEFENTNVLGRGKKYSRFWVPGKAYTYQAFDLNHSYQDCDVFVSLAKMKEHITAGVTLSMKNCFGITPTSIYGDDAGEDDPNECPRAGRGKVCHAGVRQPAKCALPELDPSSPRQGTYRIPRIIVDVVAARPVHLAIIDGVESMAGGEGVARPGVRPVSPGVLVAGTNCITTDAVATALMGYDPMADRGTSPFERCDSTLRLAEDRGIGTRDLRRIEVVGIPIRKALFDFKALRERRKH